MDILGQSALLVSVISLALGLSVLARNFRNTLFLNFFVFTSLLSAWALFFFMAELWQNIDFYRVHLFFNLWITPAALLLIRQLVRVHDRAGRVLLALSVLFSGVLTPVLILGLDKTNWVRQVVYFVPAFVVMQVFALMLRDWRIERGVELGRKKTYIYAGALLTLSTSVMNHVPWLGDVIPVIGNVALTIYLFFLSQAITQQRLLNFGAILARFVVMTTIALTLTGIYSLLFSYIAHNPALFLLNSFIVSFLIVMGLDPLRAGVSYLAERYFSERNRRLEVTLREGQRRLAGILDPETLFGAIRDFVGRVIAPDSVALYVLQADGTRYRRVGLHRFVAPEGRSEEGSEPGREPGGLRELLAGSPLIEASLQARAKGGLPILFDAILEAELERSASRSRREKLRGTLESLRALDGNLLIPLIDAPPSERGEAIGFVLLQVSEPPRPWSGNWALLQVVYPYFEQAARALRNLEVYVRSREKERLAALGEMAAGLAHEIRNPLGAIKGAAQFLDPGAARPESRFLQVIVEEVDRLNRVVSQFLEYSKPEPLPNETADLRAIARDCAELLSHSAPKGITIEWSSGGAEPVFVQGSAEKLKQVVLNLLQNAMRAIESKGTGGRVSMTLGSSSGGRGKSVQLTVEDDGVGIRAEHLPKLFIPFFTTSPGGTGLGLSISQKIVEAHGGRIEVESEEGRFTRFSVHLPVAGGSGNPLGSA